MTGEREQALERDLAGARRELHRYAARLTGSVFDGEDVVQDVMMRALTAPDRPVGGLPLRAWLFRVAHNRALDLVRTRQTRTRLAASREEEQVPEATPFEAVALNEAVTLAIARFLELPPLQRSVVVLKDVLEESNNDIAAILGLTLQSVKAHLHRGRARVSDLAQRPPQATSRASARPETRRYVDLFNARDWAGLQQLLADDVKLVQAAKATTVGRTKVASQFFTGYAASTDWRTRCASVEGRDVVWVDSSCDDGSYLMVIGWEDGHVTSIQDFRYARYVAEDATPRFYDGTSRFS